MTVIRCAAVAAFAFATTLPGISAAQDFTGQIGARQGQMRILALNVGILAQMARGNIDYDAELAAVAAGNIAAVSTIDQSVLWPEGSDNGTTEGTNALPAVWEDHAAFLGNWDDLGAGAEALAATAGDGLEAVQAGLGGVGSACGTCHETFRESE